MSSERAQWEDVKNNYLRLIQQSLASLNHPRRFEILGNVEEHLERKYAELPPDKRTWESYQQIITEMGPPAEYAALLCDDIRHSHQSKVNWGTAAAVIFVVVLSFVGTYLITQGDKEKPEAETQIPAQTPPEKTKTFELDEKVLGEWFSIDFVNTMEQFDPNQKSWQGELFLKSLNFYNQGSVEWCAGDNEHRAYRQWTKGKLDPNETIPGLYTIRPIDGIDYLFIEWISGDVTIRGQKPKYYVLTRKPKKVPFIIAAMSEKNPEIPLQDSNEVASSVIEQPKVLPPAPAAEPTILGKWIAVDYVPKAEDFMPNQRQYQKTLILKTLEFNEPSTVYWSFNNNVLKQTSFGETAVETVNGYSARYTLKTIDGWDYLFVDWMTVDVVEGKQAAWKYVLKRESMAPQMQTASQLSSDEDSGIVNNPNVRGKWTSVDFVREMDQFNPSERSWNGSFYLTGLEFQNSGQVWFSFNNGSRFPHSWVPGKVETGESQPAFYTVKNIDGNLYMFFEWISGDVTMRGQKPYYYVLKKAGAPQISGGKTSDRKIIIGANYCTMNFIESKFGPATKREEKMLRYPAKGVDFGFFNSQLLLSEVHLNQGYQGQLKTGISLTSTADDVFRAYGSPLRILQANDLHGIKDERILYQKGDMSRIYYGKHGLIFWFRDDKVIQIVIFSGEAEIEF